MSTAKLKFDLDEERYEFLCAVHGHELFSTLFEIDNKLRNLLKHSGIDDISSDKLAEEIRVDISEVLFKIQNN